MFHRQSPRHFLDVIVRNPLYLSLTFRMGLEPCTARLRLAPTYGGEEAEWRLARKKCRLRRSSRRSGWRAMSTTATCAIRWCRGIARDVKTIIDSAFEDGVRPVREPHPTGCSRRRRPHRLFAIIEANVSIRMMVSFGVPMDAQGVIDDNVPRTMVDTMKLVHGRPDVGNMHVAIAKRLLGDDLRGGRLSRQELVAALDQHRDAIDFAAMACKRVIRGITTAPVVTVIARAWYSVDHARLTRFSEALMTGELDPMTEQPVLALRNWLLEKAPLRGGGNSTRKANVTYLVRLRASPAGVSGR